MAKNIQRKGEYDIDGNFINFLIIYEYFKMYDSVNLLTRRWSSLNKKFHVEDS